MKQSKFFLFAIFLLVLYPIKSQELNKKTIDYFSKELQYKPLQEDYLYILNTEVSNLQYAEYCYWLLRKKGVDAYQKALPDSSVWMSQSPFYKPYVEYYFRHPAYKNYPVVGVSYQQAQAFSQWVAERIMENENFGSLNIEKLIGRLPSEKEWMKAARGTLPETAIWPWEGNTTRVEKGKKKDLGKFQFNYKRDKGENSEFNEDRFITTQTYAYWPNTIGLYNICGNVAEWTEEKMAKGGSWNQAPYQARIDYESPIYPDTFRSASIGFRFVFEIVSYKKTVQTKPYSLNAELLEKYLKPVNDSLYASIFETSNLLYNTFLKENQDASLTINNNEWLNYTRYAFQLQHNWLPRFDFHPVVNISHENAVKFCEWLTIKYNSFPKRKFKKVLFKLPTKEEWEMAARGVYNSNPYPWGNYYIRDYKGQYQANFSPLEEQYFNGYLKTEIKTDSNTRNIYQSGAIYMYPNNDFTISRKVDGYEFLCDVNSYLPNKFGLYNMAGNAAEMLAEKGICKGGSWNSHNNSIQIGSSETYTKPSPTIGFRYFMKVEEK
jgi:formylglycine-generating enzyme required for sulfatase activity